MSEHPSSAKSSFSQRQLQVLDLIAQGKSNKEIAADLKITYGTVKQHLFTIFKMLGVSSRGKVAILAREVLDSHQFDGIKKSGIQNKKGYAWRLISAVAFLSSDLPPPNPEAVLEHNRQMMEFRQFVMKLTQALDGRAMPLPDGGLLTWFGHPAAHLDDADRACQLAQAVSHWLIHQKSSTPHIGIGIASHAEVVPTGTQDLISVEVYRSALSLAKQSLNMRLPLANALVQKLAPHSVPWVQIKPKKSPSKDVVNSPVFIAIGPNPLASKNLPTQWGGMPFLAEVCTSAEGGIAQWLAVESWPPSITTALIDAIGNEAMNHGFEPIHIRLPANKQTDAVCSCILTQLECYLPSKMKFSQSFADGNAERLTKVLMDLSKQNSIVLLVYGIHALPTLQTILGEKGVDRLVGSRIMVVAGNVQNQGEPLTSVRLLGPRPHKPLFSRVLTMTVPDLDLLPEGVRLDLQALLDQLSPVANSLIYKAAISPEKSIEDLVLELKSPRPVLQAAIQELASFGLILPSQGNGFEFRDLATAHAIKQLSAMSLAA